MNGLRPPLTAPPGFADGKLPNNRNIASLSYDEYERHPEKLKKMNGYPTLYYYKKGEGLTILGE